MRLADLGPGRGAAAAGLAPGAAAREAGVPVSGPWPARVVEDVPDDYWNETESQIREQERLDRDVARTINLKNRDER